MWEVHSCQDALDYNTGRATDRQMPLLQLDQALSSKRSVLFSLSQCGNFVFAQCLMKPKCLEISCCFSSLNFSDLSLHVDMQPGQKKEGLPCQACKYFHLVPAPASLCGVQYHKEAPALDIPLPTAIFFVGSFACIMLLILL